MRRLTFFLLAACIAAMTAPAASAQIKYVAVVETELDARSGASADLSAAEVALITAELRREAVKNLPQDKYNIMTSETVQAQGGAVLEECADENCVIILGSKIGADYIVRGIISKFKTRLTLSVEMYETENGTLVASSDPIRSENAAELLEKASAACADMYKTFVSTRSPAKKALVTPVTYTVTAVANPLNGGAVSRNPDQTYYAPGTNVNITAVPANGYRFTGWSGASTSKSATLAGPIDRDLALTANFQYTQKTYTLKTNVFPQEGGYATRNPDKEAYTSGERVTVTAMPASGYKFTGWTSVSAGRKNNVTVTMDGDKTLTANFYRKLDLEAKPEPSAPKPDAGVAKEPPAERRYKLAAAVGLDAVGAGILLYGLNRESNVKDNIDAMMWGDAENSAKQRNIAYTVGSIILLSGISVHIFF